MGGGHRVRDLRNQFDSRFQRDLGQAALLFGPLDKVAAFRVFRFEKVRRGVKLPIEDASNVVTSAQGFLEQAKYGDFALKGAKLLRVETELEDPLFTSGLVHGKPDFAEGAFAQFLSKDPVGTLGNRLAGGWTPA